MNTFANKQEYPVHSIIDTLSDDVLLCIFDSYRRTCSYDRVGTWWPWHKFVHVCQRWRRLVFAFPSYLDLQLKCKTKADVRAMLDVWPALPLYFRPNLNTRYGGEGAIIGALEHRDRMAGISIRVIEGFQLEKCMASMRESFPVLKFLDLWVDEKILVIPDTFLGGSAPLLQTICLHGIQFPSLPKLLSSTRNLVKLSLKYIPLTGDIPPDVMATCLSILTKLRSLTLKLLPPHLTNQRSPSSAHAVLPTLTYLCLQGPHGYLEDLVARIDAPLLNSGHLEFHDEPTFDTLRVPQFIYRTEMFGLLGGAQVCFHGGRNIFKENIHATFHSLIGPAKFSLSFLCHGLPAQVAIMEQICAQWAPLTSHVELLKLYNSFPDENKEREGLTPWLGFLRSFTAVKTLCLAVKTDVPHVVHILGRLEGERATEVLPALGAIELDCEEQRASEVLPLLGAFLVARKESGHPVVVNVGSEF